MKFDRWLGSNVANPPVKFQSDRTIPNRNPTASKLQGLAIRQHIFPLVTCGPDVWATTPVPRCRQRHCSLSNGCQSFEHHMVQKGNLIFRACEMWDMQYTVCIKNIDLLEYRNVRMTFFLCQGIWDHVIMGLDCTVSMQCLFYMGCMFSNKNSKPCCPLIGRACECWEFNMENARKMLTWWCLNMEEWGHFQGYCIWYI